MPEVQVACVYGGANMEKQAKRLAEAARSWWQRRAV